MEEMRFQQFLLCTVILGTTAWAQEPTLAAKWESQIRPLIQNVQQNKKPFVTIRIAEESGPEHLIAIYKREGGSSLLAWAETREITAESFSNLFKFELKQNTPPIPIHLRTLALTNDQVKRWLTVVNKFIVIGPKTSEWHASTGHGGWLEAYYDGRFHHFEGPIPAVKEPSIVSLINKIYSVQKSMKKSPTLRLYEFPEIPELTQWRFSCAVMKGDESLSIFLLSIGASPDKDPKFFQSPLEQAIINNQPKLFEALINFGANTNIITGDGISLVDSAKKYQANWAIPLLHCQDPHNQVKK